MAKQLPEKWQSLNVATDLGLRGDYPRNLAVYKVKGTEKLGCRWLPSEQEDTRPNKGRNNSGKRKYLFGRTGTDDPFQAGKAAINWCIGEKKKLVVAGAATKFDSSHSLHHYFEIFYRRLCDNPKKGHRAKTDTLNKWNGKEWGIGEQSFSHKSIEDINALDIAEYFLLLDQRGQRQKAKEAQKTLLNHLNKEALDDFPYLQPFRFPVIEQSKNQVEHFTKEEWEKIVKKVIQLSGAQANKSITQKQYLNLEWTERTIFNKRNWVDFYDCLMLMWFFYLRSMDMPTIQCQWFKEVGVVEGVPTVHLKMEKTKQDRDKLYTEHYRPKGFDCFKRIKKRKPKGYLGFPHYLRKEGEEDKSQVVETLNKMLKRVVDLCHIKKRKVVWTVVRHTSFRLTLEEYPELGGQELIGDFADNGLTSPAMLEERYLNFIGLGKTAAKARAKLKPNTWEMVKGRVSLDE